MSADEGAESWRITSIKVAGRELVGGLEFRTPDSDPQNASADAEDRSVCRVPLHDAVAPDETIAIWMSGAVIPAPSVSRSF